jgi:uncharacterized protein with LGFP repeats
MNHTEEIPMNWPRLSRRPAPRRRRSWQPNLEKVEQRQLLSAISAEYAATAQETDAYGRVVQKDLGVPTSGVINVPGVAGARMETFQGGAIYWSPGTGAHVVYGGIDAKYNSLGGPVGYGLPTSDEAWVPGLPGVRVTDFQHGADLYWSAATGAHAVYGAIGVEYAATAHETDAYGRDVQAILGAPTSDEMNVPGVAGARMETFQGGAIYWSPGTGAHVVYGAIGGKYNSLGGPVGYGLPTSDEANVPGLSGVRVTDFQHGADLYWSAATGAHAVYGAIGVEYAATAHETDCCGRDVQAILGAPTSDEMNVPGVAGARMNTFQGGAIYWSPGTGAHVVYGAILAEYQATAHEYDYYGNVVQNLIGLPTSDEANVSGQQGGRVTDFQGGAIFWSSTTGAHVLYGAIDAKFNSLGGASYIGLPTTDEATTSDGAGRDNHFERIGPGGGALAAIDWTPSTGAHAVTGPIAAKFASTGWEASGEAITDGIDIATLTYFGAYNCFEHVTPLPWPFPPLVYQFAIDYTPKTGATVDHGPEYSDVVQGDAGTCWIDASIAALESSGVDLAQQIHYQGNNTYTVALYNFNDPKNRQGGGMHSETQTVYFDGDTYGADAHFNPDEPSQSWALIMQRAVIQAVEEWDPSQSIQHPHSGTADDPLSILTGRTTQWDPVGDSGIQQTVSSALASGKAVALNTKQSGTVNLTAFHYYAVLSANNQGVTMYNPYGFTVTVSWSVIAQDGNGFMIC